MSEMRIDGLVLAPNVVETVVAVAAKDVEGVASIGMGGVAGMADGVRRLISAKPQPSGVEVVMDEEGAVSVDIHIEVVFGFVLPDVAAKVRAAVADAMESQLGVQIARIDVYVDALRFE